MVKYIKINDKPINYRRLNVCSATRAVYSATKVYANTIIATNIEAGIKWEVSDDIKGGIIVFSDEVNAVKLSDNKLINWLKHKYATISNKFGRTKKIDKVAQDNDLVGWTVGKFLKGRYTGDDGNVYSENSLSVEIIGVDFDKLVEIAETLCREFNQESVLVKDYSTLGRIVFVDGN